MTITAKNLKNELMRKELDEKKEVHIIMEPGKRPEVTFIGFWTGKFIKGAMDSIAKAYRVQKYTLFGKPQNIPNTEPTGGKK